MASKRTDIRLANEAWESLMTAYSRLSTTFGAEPIWGEVSMREYDVLYTLLRSLMRIGPPCLRSV